MSPAPAPTRNSRRRPDRVITFGLLVLLLCVHFETRRSADTGVLSANHYPDVYRLSLSLVAGRGFKRSAFPDEPEAEPIKQFFAMERPALTAAETERYFAQPYATPLEPGDGPPPGVVLSTEERLKLEFLDSHGSTRTLDVWAVAGLWSLFGVEWRVLSIFHAVLSTLACLCVFGLTRQAAGTRAGFVAVGLFIFTPLENDYAATCPRDISPLWFGSFAFWSVACVAGRFSTLGANLASIVACGAAATLGYGWRVDPILVVPATLVLLLLRLISRKWSGPRLLGAVACYVLGACLLLAAIPALGPTRVKLGGSQQGFTMGYYANAARCNLFGLENSFQVVRCDIQLVIAARHFAETHAVDGRARPHMSDSFFRSCALMFRETFSHDAYTWVKFFPSLCVRAITATHLVDLPIWRNPFPVVRTAADRVMPRRVSAWGGVTLAMIGLVAAVCLQARPWTALSLGLFWAYDVAALLVVLPEYKHTGMLVLPKCVLGAIGITAVFRVVAGRHLAPLRRRMSIVLAGCVALAATWSLALGAAALHSRQARAAVVDAIERIGIATSATPDPGALVGPRRLSIRRNPGAAPDPVGYLITVRTGARRGLLRLRQVRWHEEATERAIVWGSLTRAFETRHPLTAAQEHRFFFTCLQGSKYGDTRPYVCHVLIEGDATIESALRVDLSAWRGPLVSTLLGQDSIGSPALGPRATSELLDPATLDADGLTAADQIAWPEAPR